MQTRRQTLITASDLQRLCVFGLLMSLLTACSAPSPKPVVSEPAEGSVMEPVTTPEPTVIRPIKPESKPETSRTLPTPPASQMLAQAEQSARGGDYNRALLLLDRAQRLSPQAGDVYLSMARVSFDLEQFQRAEQLCLKALSLGGSDREFRKQVWQTMAVVRDARHDVAGAAAARKQAAAL